MRFIKENWFRFTLLVFFGLSILLFGFNLYIGIQKHNLEVINSIRYCSSSDFNEEGRKACAAAVKRTYIFKYAPPATE
ncbi:MAG: hypothetical protein A2751_05835 [Candidatus Doudnabacteria bacterium RIFCSPHIGHO2_01_FULL_46_14]|uniref:Uncharacterized protein n=1 Tax=Candidatus Doudnabacteria bacterium RIFCSPHIGHO2_01_FULL_46_14 TaxID=1817824 RepID=A0A1F5NP36_9BACT|nr:MAG: hypothetical protein A2751_05835 [Candidatus Doudnabacteria bacterium RIFCSPHIGHO2_01_FULL_46_14]